MHCGGSLRLNSGRRLGRASDANCVDERGLHIANTFGRMEGNSCVSFICMNQITSVSTCAFGPAYFFKQRRQNFPRPKAFRKFIQDSHKSLHE